MTAFTLLIICLIAQILIAAWLGIFFLRRHRQQKRREKEIARHPEDRSSNGSQ
jgi:preprotein translocase subunit YajC